MNEQLDISEAADGWGYRVADLVHRGGISSWRKCRSCGKHYEARMNELNSQCEECRR